MPQPKWELAKKFIHDTFYENSQFDTNKTFDDCKNYLE